MIFLPIFEPRIVKNEISNYDCNLRPSYKCFRSQYWTIDLFQFPIFVQCFFLEGTWQYKHMALTLKFQICDRFYKLVLNDSKISFNWCIYDGGSKRCVVWSHQICLFGWMLGIRATQWATHIFDYIYLIPQRELYVHYLYLKIITINKLLWKYIYG
jgi:hypothetical protein